MKSFHFESIWLLSHREKKALRIMFHPRRNIIKGVNHTGKSSLVKTLFTTLGAKPQGKLEKWDEQLISALDLNISGERFRIVNQGSSRSVYRDGVLISAMDSNAAWSKFFADLVEFNLVVSSKSGDTIQADPACFFLPFYIDQDGSWRDKWDTFPSTHRFVSPIQNILEYFTGVKPSKYYELKSEHKAVSKEADTVLSEIRLLESARGRVKATLSTAYVNLSEAGFENEVVELTEEANKLLVIQESLRERHVRDSELVTSIEQQVKAAESSLNIYTIDKKYLTTSNEDSSLVCPTCGAEHETSFLHFLGYAEDARVLERLTLTLRQDLAIARQRHIDTNSELRALGENYSKLNKILGKKKGNVQFKEIVESQGTHVALSAFDVGRQEMAGELAQMNTQLTVLQSQLDELADKKRAKSILTAFRAAYADARRSLGVAEPTGAIKLTSRPNRSGSGGPRLLLAYYSALWKVCFGKENQFSFPVVIDSPNQQDQDEMNLHVVLGFISESIPSEQLIVCVTDDSETEFDNTIMLNEKYSLLQESEYEIVEAEIGPLYRQMNQALLAVVNSDN
jgi:hypothetical protein